MKEIMKSIFGVYTPVTVQQVAADGTTYEQALTGMAGVDWPYVGGVLLFAIIVYCLFRILGVILK